MSVQALMKAFWRAVTRACVELAESEAGEFMTTREKSRLLDALMRDQRERQRAKTMVHAEANETPLTARHIQSA